MKTAAWREPFRQDPELELWYQNLARGSDATAEERARILWRYCRLEKTTPQGLVAEGRSNLRSLENSIARFIHRCETKGDAPSYIRNYVKAVTSWLRYNDIRTREFKIKNADSTPSLVEECVPEKHQLADLFNNATPRGRVTTSFMAFSGTRPMTLGNKDGTDGLRLKDLPELQIKDGKVTFLAVPTLVVVRGPLSKAGHQYLTFLGPQGCQTLKAELEMRMARGEVLHRDSAVVRVKVGYEGHGVGRAREKQFIISRNVVNDVRDAMGAVYDERPYVLRAYFDTQLMLAESAGMIPHSYRVFWMGHKGDMEQRYTLNKHRLPKTVLEDMRAGYAKACQFLETWHKPVGEDHTYRLLRLTFQMAGYDESELKSLDIMNKTDDQIAALLRARQQGVKTTAGPSQKVAELADLEAEMGAGWIFKANLPNGKVVLERPARVITH